MNVKLSFAASLSLLLATSCDPASGIAGATLGNTLDKMQERANHLIQEGRTAGLILEVNGGAQVQNLIMQARTAYKDELNESVNAIGVTQQRAISDIDGLLNKVQGGAKIVTKDVQQIASTLPFANLFPQVKDYSGTIISPNMGPLIIVQLDGNFVHLAKQGYEAVLKINNKSYKALSRTAQELKFSVPIDNIKNKSNKISYEPFSVEVNYSKKNLLIFDSKQVATFKFYFIRLPARVGTYKFVATFPKDTVLRQDNVPCPNLIWNTHNNSDDDNVRGCAMDDGWICDVASVRPEFLTTENAENVDWFNRGSVSTPAYAGWHFLATTKHGWFGNYGGVTVNLRYTRYKTVNISHVDRTPEIPLQWGSSKVIDIPTAATWKLIFKQFDGSPPKEIASSSQLSPYIRVTTHGQTIEVKTAPFD